MDIIYLIASGGGLALLGVVRQVRIGLNRRGDRQFARHVFDQTRSTTALDGYAELIDKNKTWELTVPRLRIKNEPPQGAVDQGPY